MIFMIDICDLYDVWIGSIYFWYYSGMRKQEYIYSGAINESEDNTGMGRFLEHMQFREDEETKEIA
jgi:hypothetical protein